MWNSFRTCIYLSWATLKLFPTFKLIGMVLVPFIASFMNIMMNSYIATSPNNILTCMGLKFFYDYITWIVQNAFFYRLVRQMTEEIILRLNMAKIRCGVPIPGVNQKQHKDLLHDQSKLRDFLFVLPMFWSTIVNFSISIYMMEVSDVYPIRFLFSLFCIFMCCLITYLTDSSVYEKTKPSPLSVTQFNDSQYVKMKISMGSILDTDFEKNKRIKIEKQQNIQKYIILVINLVITYISLTFNSVRQFHSFGNISWMIGCLADNIKSLQYYTYMIEFIEFTQCLESHRLNCDGKISVGKINKIEFVNASFGYYDDDLMNNPTRSHKITNLSYVFKLGVFYYLEAPNGIGKSTTLKMLTSNLFSGDIFFGNTNRKNLSFEDIQSSVFHIVQASEYTPKFSLEEIKSYKGRDIWLEEKLGLGDLFEKDTVEMSGGQKKRMFIYIVLTSSPTILLLDEILSELSTEETPDVPEGGGWLCRVINTLVEWKGRKNKIIVLVGHGLIDLIPSKPRIIKLKLSNEKGQTMLFSR
jgi:energy-coupling factor transporter ATP-binding protein EcfA2